MSKWKQVDIVAAISLVAILGLVLVSLGVSDSSLQGLLIRKPIQKPTSTITATIRHSENLNTNPAVEVDLDRALSRDDTTGTDDDNVPPDNDSNNDEPANDNEAVTCSNNTVDIVPGYTLSIDCTQVEKIRQIYNDNGLTLTAEDLRYTGAFDERYARTNSQSKMTNLKIIGAGLTTLEADNLPDTLTSLHLNSNNISRFSGDPCAQVSGTCQVCPQFVSNPYCQ